MNETKICTRCKQEFPLSNFYCYNGKCCCYCKKCASYLRNHPIGHPIGKYIDKETGKVMYYKSNRGRPGIYWSPYMLWMMRKHYANTTNAELAELLGVTVNMVSQKAHKLGLYKSTKHRRNIGRENVINKTINQRKRKNQSSTPQK